MRIKITNVKNPKSFMDVVEKCEGSVQLVTSEGDNINLKSTLAQFIAIANIFTEDGGVKTEIPGVELEVSEQSDVTRLVEFMMNGC